MTYLSSLVLQIHIIFNDDNSNQLVGNYTFIKFYVPSWYALSSLCMIDLKL